MVTTVVVTLRVIILLVRVWIIGLGLALILGFMTRWAALAALPIMIGAIVPHAGNGFTFSNTGGGWEYPVFWTIALAVQAMLGDGAYAIGNPLKQKD